MKIYVFTLIYENGESVNEKKIYREFDRLLNNDEFVNLFNDLLIPYPDANACRFDYYIEEG